MKSIRIEVLGAAATAGSKRAFAMRRRDGSLVMRANGTPVVSVTDDCAAGKKWRRTVQAAAWAVLPRGFEPLSGPLRVSFRFELARPQGHYGTGRNAGVVLRSAPRWHVQKPDVLKLARAAEDALTEIVYRDDSQIVDERLEKVWGAAGRLVILIDSVEDQATLFDTQEAPTDGDMPW